LMMKNQAARNRAVLRFPNYQGALTPFVRVGYLDPCARSGLTIMSITNSYRAYRHIRIAVDALLKFSRGRHMNPFEVFIPRLKPDGESSSIRMGPLEFVVAIKSAKLSLRGICDKRGSAAFTN
jgi:hypothetical protein